MVFYWRPLCIDGVGVNPKTRSLAKRKGAGSISGCPSHWTFTYCFFSEGNFRQVCSLNSLMFKVPQPDFCLFLSTYNCLISLCFLCSPGHFTQVVWKSSSKLGVGIARKNGHILVVANYDPPGNYQGQYANNVRRSWRLFCQRRVPVPDWTLKQRRACLISGWVTIWKIVCCLNFRFLLQLLLRISDCIVIFLYTIVPNYILFVCVRKMYGSNLLKLSPVYGGA